MASKKLVILRVTEETYTFSFSTAMFFLMSHVSCISCGSLKKKKNSGNEQKDCTTATRMSLSFFY